MGQASNLHSVFVGQLPDSRKQSQADLYLETYQVLDIEIGRLREIQVWQANAASKASLISVSC